MNVLTAITQLWPNRPGPTTINKGAAAWFAARAALDKQLALTEAADTGQARGLASRAEERSAELLSITHASQADAEYVPTVAILRRQTTDMDRYWLDVSAGPTRVSRFDHA